MAFQSCIIETPWHWCVLAPCAEYGLKFTQLPELVAAARAPQWSLAAVAVACLGLVFTSVYITQIEQRLPLVYYKRHARVQPNCSIACPVRGFRVHISPARTPQRRALHQCTCSAIAPGCPTGGW